MTRDGVVLSNQMVNFVELQSASCLPSLFPVRESLWFTVVFICVTDIVYSERTCIYI